MKSPRFVDDGSDLDRLFGRLPEGGNISIRGVRGSGKTFVGGYITKAALESGRVCRVVVLGDREDGRELLYQTTGNGLDLLTHLPGGNLAIQVDEDPTCPDVAAAVEEYARTDLMVVDPLDDLAGGTNESLERVLFWLANRSDTSMVCIGKGGVGEPRPYADMSIDLSRTGEDVEDWDADSIMSVSLDDETVTKAFRVRGQGIDIWDLT